MFLTWSVGIPRYKTGEEKENDDENGNGSRGSGYVMGPSRRIRRGSTSDRAADAGSELEDWLRAEHELRHARNGSGSFTTTRRRATRLAVEHDLASK
jgi:hypothetical protein